MLVIVPVIAIVAFLGLAGPPEQGRAVGEPGAPGDLYPRVLLSVVVILGACAVVGALFRRIGQPAVVGEIVTGILLGPSLLGAVWPDAAAALFPSSVLPQLDALAQLGVLLFAFVAGLKVDTRLLRGRGDVAVVVSHVSIAVPFLLGVLLSLLAYRDLGRLADARRLADRAVRIVSSVFGSDHPTTQEFTDFRRRLADPPG